MEKTIPQTIELTEKLNHIPFVAVSFGATILILLGLYFYSRMKLKKAIKLNQELTQETSIKEN